MHNANADKRHIAAKVALEIQIGNGRRLFTMHALRDLVRNKTIECQNDKDPFKRQYRILPPEMRGEKAHKAKRAVQPKPEKPEKLETPKMPAPASKEDRLAKALKKMGYLKRGMNAVVKELHKIQEEK